MYLLRISECLVLSTIFTNKDLAMCAFNSDMCWVSYLILKKEIVVKVIIVDD